MSKHLISVVVLTCTGRKKELFRCLKSVKKSNYQNIEIVVVANDCPSRLTKEIKSQFPKTKVILLPANTGCFGFNVGYANAKGKYILSLDDDTSINKFASDEIKSDTIEKIVNVFEKKPENVGIISIAAYNPKSKHYYFPSLDEFTGFQAGGAAFRKELFNEVGYYDKDFFLWGEEDDFALRVLDAGYQIALEKTVVINHYEKRAGLRKKQIFFNARNKAWLNIKHFSPGFIPLLFFRDLIWILLLPYRKRSFRALYFGIKGYISGWLSFWTPLKKRKVISLKIQKKFLKFYLFGNIKRLKNSIV